MNIESLEDRVRVAKIIEQQLTLLNKKSSSGEVFIKNNSGTYGMSVMIISNAEEFINSDEAFATSTAGGIIPITKINGKKINNGKIGKVTSLLKNLYWEKHADPLWSQSVDELI